MPNGFPFIRVYRPEVANTGLIYGLVRFSLRSRTPYFPINAFLNEPQTQGEDGFKGFYSDLRGLQTYVDPALNGALHFRSDLRHEFCEKGFALPPEEDNQDEDGPYGTRLRAYLMRWNPRTIILLDGVIKRDSGPWQRHEYLRRVVCPLIDIYFAIKDGLANEDFFELPDRAGFFDEQDNLLEEIELIQYVEHGQRLSCNRDSS
jgi:hypothetical protein